MKVYAGTSILTLNDSTRGVGGFAKFSIIASVFFVGTLGLLTAGTTHGAFVTYNFLGAGSDNNTPANPVSALSSVISGNGEWGATVTINDGDGNPVKLTSVEAWGPVYQHTGTGATAWTWDGLTYTQALTRIHSTTSGLGVHNINYNPGSGNQNIPLNLERQSFNPQESWTFKLDKSVIFNQLVFISWASADGDEITITVDGWAIPVHHTGGATLNTPFVTNVIPAGTEITLKNSASVVPLANNTSNPGPTNWRISSLRFEVVPTPDPIPEPSTVALVGVGLVGLGLLRRKRRK